MRFFADGPSIPDVLLERCDAGRVVFLCGAGVSQPSGMPSFVGLTQHVIDVFDPPSDSEIMDAFRPWLEGQSAANVPLDQIFNLLHQEYGKDEVNALVTERLNVVSAVENVGREHDLVKRISSSQSGAPQIVTTNFDRLFEAGSERTPPKIHEPPALPSIHFGSTIEGITYLHGRLVEPNSEHHPYVLSSADFGRAYLSEGWATSFVRNLLERYTVVLLGYQAEDPPIKYLLQGLNHDGRFDRSRLYAFDRGRPENIEAKWRDRGVTPIAYPDHPDLWRTLEAWADRADNPRVWRASVIATSAQDPKMLQPHERGQVAHILRTPARARQFAEADPSAHPEWVCVMDAFLRSAKPSRELGDNAETFDPRVAYGLDDDLTEISEEDRRRGISNDNLLVWRNEDDSPVEFHRLAGRQAEGYETTPIRLGHLIAWISKRIESPVLAWWAIRQNGLHPRLLREIEWQLDRLDYLDNRARHLWNLILEHHRDPRNRQWNGDWFDLKKRIKKEGWTAGTLREFRRATAPRLNIKAPYGLAEASPPSSSWDELRLRDLGRFEVSLVERHNERLDIPDNVLPQVFRILEEQLAAASGLLIDVETTYFPTPTYYPDREVDGEEMVREPANFLKWFASLFDRMVELSPELARAHATTWPARDRFFFRKLKLYALSKTAAFAGEEVASEVLAIDQEAFWDIEAARELLFLLADRWNEFSPEDQGRLTDRILSGPDQRPHWSDEKYPEIRDEFASRYARFLELQGCTLSLDNGRKLAEMTEAIPGWSDGWATSVVVRHGMRSGWVGTDEAPDAVQNLPVNEVVEKAKEDLTRDFASFTERRPFTGLVKANPRKALAALTAAARSGDYPAEFWRALVENFPSDVVPRLRRIFLLRLTRLPYSVVAELDHTLGRWLEQKLDEILEFDEDIGWGVFDHMVAGIISGGPDASESGLGEVHQAGEVVERSRRTYDHAINGPVGMCAEALFKAVPGESQEAGSLVPAHIKSRLERLFAAPGEGSDHAVSVTAIRLNWLMHVDPDWTEERLLPMLTFEHPASEPAWNGFLSRGRVPLPPLAALIKPLLLELFPWVEGLSWDRDLSRVAAQWLGYMRLFHPDEASGLSRQEMRSVLRAMSDDTRNNFIFWLGQVGQGNENGWIELVVPFIENEWPRERRYRTSASIMAWIGLLDDTGENFPAVYHAMKAFLVPVEMTDYPFYRFTREVNEEEPITVRFPRETLDLMNRVTPGVLSRPSYQLGQILALIAETEPTLTSDQRYIRLVDLLERS